MNFSKSMKGRGPFLGQTLLRIGHTIKNNNISVSVPVGEGQKLWGDGKSKNCIYGKC